jgi:hypothetical protein
MSEYDKNNLLFLMNMSSSALEDWFLQASDDDRNYAEELMAEAHLIAIDDRVARMRQFKEAEQVLSKFI